MSASAQNGTFTADQISIKPALDLQGMSGEPSSTITMADSTSLTYVDYLLLLLRNHAHELRNERPLMKSKTFITFSYERFVLRIPSDSPGRKRAYSTRLYEVVQAKPRTNGRAQNMPGNEQ